MKATHIWLTVLTVALVLNAVMMRTPAEGDECTAGIRKEHLDQTDGAFVDGSTIEIGSNGLKVADTIASSTTGFSPAAYAGGQSVTLPNGLIMKYGFVNPNVNNKVISFATPFSTECTYVGITLAENLPTPYATMAYNVSEDGFTFRCGSGAYDFYWMAIGY